MTKLEKVYRILVGKLYVQERDAEDHFKYIPAAEAEKTLPKGKHLTDCYPLLHAYDYGWYSVEFFGSEILKEMEKELFGARKKRW